MISDGTVMFPRSFEAEFLLGVMRGAGGAMGCGFAVGERTRDVDDVTGDAVGGEVLLGVEMPLGPFPCRSIRTQEQHRYRRGSDENERHDKSNTPGDVCGKTLVQDQGVENRRHEEISDAAARVAETACQGVGCADDVFVEEAGRPDLAGDETPAQDPDEEAQSQESGDIGYGPGKGGRDGACEEAAGEGVTGAEAVAGGTGDEADEEAGGGGQWVLGPE